MKSVLLKNMDLLGMTHHGLMKFKGGGGSPPSSNIRDTELTKQARKQLYPAIESAMAGDGFGGLAVTNPYRKQLYTDYDKAFGTAKADLQSQLNRTLDPRDIRTQVFMTQQLARDYNTGKDVINRQLEAERVSDIDMGRTMAADAVSMEKRMGISGAQMYNQSLQQNMLNERQFGTFGTNVAGGVGSGLMNMYFAKQMAK